MPKQDKTESLSAAECARRTGLTVRALRVYEQHGLIQPARSGKGWRIYGSKDLQRLNVIVTLKAFGMTLEQIHSLLKRKSLPLARVLEMQLRACRTRRDDAQRALELVQSALATIESGQVLALEDLCNLTRSMEMGTHHAIVRELINEEITPQEERAYMTWAAARPSDEIKAMQAYGAAVKPLFRSLQDLRDNKAEPTSSEVQAIITDWNTLAVRHGLRAFMATLMEWNPVVAQKWLQVGERALARSMAAQQAAPDEGLWAYFGAAQEASPWHQELKQISTEATHLAANNKDAASDAAKELVARLTRICQDHSLGDPGIYARWASAMQFRRSADENSRSKAGWAYLVKALSAAHPQTPT